MRRPAAILSGSAALLLVLTGCPLADPLFTGGAKVLQQNMTALNPDEVIALYEFAVDYTHTPNAPVMTEAYAAAIICVLRANDLDSIPEIQAFAQQVADKQADIELGDCLRGLSPEDIRLILEALGGVDPGQFQE